MIEERLEQLGITLPEPKSPVANYLGTKQSGDFLFVSGRVSELRGLVGEEVKENEAREAAAQTLLTILAIIKEDIGSLNRIVSIEQLRGFVRSAPAFTRQPQVIDGASDLLINLWGEAGRHARTATGVHQLPYGASIQLDMIAKLSASN